MTTYALTSTGFGGGFFGQGLRPGEAATPEHAHPSVQPHNAQLHTGGAEANGLLIDSLINRARLGDDQAFSRLIEYYRAGAQRLAQQILHTAEAADDAVQDATIKAHRAMPRFQEGNFRSWFLRIVTNTCYDYLRRQKRQAAASLDEMMEESTTEFPVMDTMSSDPEELAIQGEQMRQLIKAIDALPSYHRTVVMLVDVHGYDYTEASTLLQLPLGTVKSRLSRARAALRDALVQIGLVPAN